MPKGSFPTIRLTTEVKIVQSLPDSALFALGSLSLNGRGLGSETRPGTRSLVALRPFQAVVYDVPHSQLDRAMVLMATVLKFVISGGRSEPPLRLQLEAASCGASDIFLLIAKRVLRHSRADVLDACSLEKVLDFAGGSSEAQTHRSRGAFSVEATVAMASASYQRLDGKAGSKGVLDSHET